MDLGKKEKVVIVCFGWLEMWLEQLNGSLFLYLIRLEFTLRNMNNQRLFRNKPLIAVDRLDYWPNEHTISVFWVIRSGDRKMSYRAFHKPDSRQEGRMSHSASSQSS